MIHRTKAPVTLLVAALALAGCNLLDVENPNNLVEESIRKEVAAASVVNGAQARVWSAISQAWQPYLVASDEFYWIGSRDAWQSIDHGFIQDPRNEFIDGYFPAMGEGRWLADEAIEIVTEHVANNPTAALEGLLARANLYAGIMYMVIGEVQDNFAFSDKQEPGPPVGAANMSQVLDGAITRLDAALAGAANVTAEAEFVRKVRAIRARAYHSRAIWDVLNPTVTGALPIYVNSGPAGADAAFVIADAAGSDWRYNMSYSAATVGNSMAGWINDRKENQIDLSLVSIDADFNVDGIVLQDPIDAVDDPALTANIAQFRGGDHLAAGGNFPPLTLASTRMMYLILAENALATGGDNATFRTNINAIRAMDGLTDYTGQVSANEIMQHTRRVNTFLQGLRLADMYRWGIQPSTANGSDPNAVWSPNAAVVLEPGTMFSVGVVECQANPLFTGQGAC